MPRNKYFMPEIVIQGHNIFKVGDDDDDELLLWYG